MSRFYKPNGSEVADLRAARKAEAVPSVTTVINACTPHEYKFLEDRRLKQVIEDQDLSNEDKWDILGNQAIFSDGTVVHESGELFLESGVRSDPLGLPLSSSQFFRLLSQFEPILIEEFFYSKKYNTGGRIDLLCKYKGDLSLIDYKTCSQFVKTPKKTWTIQMGIYAALLAEKGHEVKRVYILQYSKKNEGCSLIEISWEHLKYGLEIFNSARELYAKWVGV